MKLNKYFLIVVLILTVVAFSLGLYQNGDIKVGSIIISKPFGYRFQSIPVDDNVSFVELQKNLLGLNTVFELNNNMLTIIFKKIYLNNKIALTFFSFKNENEMFMLQYNKDLEKLVYEGNCIYITSEESENANKLFSIHGLIKTKNITFSIIGNDSSDILKLKENICK